MKILIAILLKWTCLYRKSRLFPKVILFIFSAVWKCLRQINFISHIYISYILLHYSYTGFYLWNVHFNDFLIKSFFVRSNQNTMEINNAIVICIIPTENHSLSLFFCYVNISQRRPIFRSHSKFFLSIDIGLM